MSPETRSIVIGGLAGTAVAIALWAGITFTDYGWVVFGWASTLAGIAIARLW